MSTVPERLLRRLEWRVGKRLDGRLQGANRTVFRGNGYDFADLRPYVPGDDVRHIDWNVTARLDEPYVRQYTEDREVTAWLVLDRSASMTAGSGSDPGKAGLLNDLAVALAGLLAGQGNPVGALLYDRGVERVIPPRIGRPHLLRLAHQLTAPRPAPTAGPGTDLRDMLTVAAATIRRRSLVFMISDLFGETGWEIPLGRLAQRHDVVVLHLVDPVEYDFPDLGLIVVEDAETGEQLLVDSGDPTFRQQLRDQAFARDDEQTATIRRTGAAVRRVSSAEDPVDALVDLVRDNRRRR